MVLYRPATQRPTISHVNILFSETTFRVMLDNNARPLHEAIRRFASRSPKVTISPDPNVKGVIVTVDVNEGPVYKLSNTKVAGMAGRESKLVNLVDLKPG